MKIRILIQKFFQPNVSHPSLPAIPFSKRRSPTDVCRERNFYIQFIKYLKTKINWAAHLMVLQIIIRIYVSSIAFETIFSFKYDSFVLHFDWNK